MINFFSILVISSVIASPLEAEHFSKIENGLDSLLLSGNEVKLKEILSAIPDSMYQHYIKLIKTIDLRRDQNIDDKIKVFEYYHYLDESFSELHAGVKGKTSFQYFKNAFEKPDYNESAFFLQTALFFRKRYVLAEKERLISEYRLAKQFYKNNNLAEAKIKISQFENEYELNPGYLAVKDSLTNLYSDLKEQIAIIERRESVYEKSIIQKRWQVDFQYAGNLPVSMKNVKWRFSLIEPQYISQPKYFRETFELIKSSPDIDQTYSLQFLLTAQIAVRVGYQTGSYTYYEPPKDLSVYGVSNVTYRIEFERIIYGISYYFTTKYGFRPFGGFSFGRLNMKPEKSSTVFYDSYQPDFKDVKSESYIFTLGADYVDENMPIVLGIRFSYSRLQKNVMYISNDIYNVQILTGLVF